MILLRRCLAGFIGLLTVTIATGQPTNDSAFIGIAKSNATKVYLNNIGAQAPWINGKLNIPYPYTFDKGSPYFESTQFVTGTLYYNGIAYPNINLVYDQMQDKLISFVDNGRFELLSNHVNGFIFNDHYFINVLKDTINRMDRGFYEQLYAGKSQVLKKVTKTVKEDLIPGVGVGRSILDKFRYYIKANNKYYSISNKKTLLNALADKKDLLQTFIRQHKLGWRKDTEKFLVETLAYYDQITK